ncbi:MAG: hypothetical protein A2V88_03375 [Elusimicrobia bacterium RBG_16_66_12]|nr:MAG: hypothetical protein A2V88_03375 [Elusimicrobia bacterium RBG_16_66_12]
MKRTLEIVLVTAALALGAFVVSRVLSRRPSAPPSASEAARPGRDEEDPRKPAGAPYAPAVKGVPMIKLSRPPRRRPLKKDIPAPPVRP